MTTSGDPRLPDAISADRSFFEQSRKLSPKFPSAIDAIERRRRRQENVAARILLGLTLAFGIGAPFAEHPGFMAGAAGACLFGFGVICFTAGSRAHKRSEQ